MISVDPQHGFPIRNRIVKIPSVVMRNGAIEKRENVIWLKLYRLRVARNRKVDVASAEMRKGAIEKRARMIWVNPQRGFPVRSARA